MGFDPVTFFAIEPFVHVTVEGLLVGIELVFDCFFSKPGIILTFKFPKLMRAKFVVIRTLA